MAIDMTSDPGSAESEIRRAVVAVIRDGSRFLVIKRSAHVVAPGKICFPGGRIESGETIEAAVIRELREELSLTIRPLSELWSNISPWGYHVHWYEAELVGGDIRMDESEVEWAGWMTMEEMERSPDLLDNNAAFIAAWKAGQIKLV